MQDSQDGISPTTAGWLLGTLALLGIGFYIFAVVLDQKSPDPLYDENNMATHTSTQLQVTPGLWKSKAPAEAPPTETPSPAPAPPLPKRTPTTSQD